MSAARFVIAKYVPDPMRMEPRNVGIVLWTKRRVAYRFLKERDASEFIDDVATYCRWIDFWKYTIDNDALELRGVHTRKSDSNYLDAFRRTQKANYIIDPCGEMLDAIKVSDIDRAVGQLFSDLVSTTGSKGPSSRINAIDDKCDQLLQDTGISQRSDFHEDKKYPITFGTFVRDISFDFAIGNGIPDILFRKSNVRSELNADANALICQHAAASFTASQRVILVSADKSDLSRKIVLERIKMLSQWSTVINVDHFGEAADALRDITSNGVG